jgi:glycosyltransferase involved in cell wall biosynthesis
VQVVDRGPTVSALMLTLNSEATIGRSLDSIKGLTKEIVIVDGGSSDQTLEIAQSRGAIIVSRKFAGFAQERNAGLLIAKGDWILSLDSDEVVSVPLKAELERLIAENIYDVIYVPRFDYVAGHIMRSFYPDYQVKLFRRGCLEYEGKVHEMPRFTGIVRLHLATNPLINYSDRTIGVRFRREVRYWTLALPGNKVLRKRALVLPITLVRYPLTLLLRRRFIRDGLHGATVALVFLAAYVVALQRAFRRFELDSMNKADERVSAKQTSDHR